MTVLIVILIVIVLLVAAFRLWLTANRLDRLHVRTEAAWAALAGALDRRVVAARAVAAAGGLDAEHAEHLRELAGRADDADRTHRADAENDLGRALAALPPVTGEALAAVLADAGERVVLARRFYNDAVRDTLALRHARFTRIFGLAGRAKLPAYFEIAEEHVAEPVVRTAARVLLLDEQNRVLVFSGSDAADGRDERWWITPGGGLRSGEDLTGALLREVAEETGVQLTGDELVGPLWRREDEFDYAGMRYRQTDFFFVARADGHRVDTSRFTGVERSHLTGHAWFSAEELAGQVDPVYPRQLPELLDDAGRALADGRVPATPAPIT